MSDIGSPFSLFDLFTQWRIDWLTVVALVVVTVGYLRVRLTGARRGIRWPPHRDVVVGAGLLAALWTTSGGWQARSSQLMWVWTGQQLLLFLVVPVIVLAGQPLALIRAVHGPRAVVLKVLDSRPVRILGHPFLGPLLVPVVAALLFFGGVGALALRSPPDGWVLHLVLLGLGVLVAIPLIDRDDTRASLAVGLALAVGLLELMFDAFPGIILTFQHHLTLTEFGMNRPSWAGAALDDQHTAGGILWAVAEVLDVPFLVLATVKWLRADAREALRVDTELDAESDAVIAATTPESTIAAPEAGERTATPGAGGPTATPERTAAAPWWLDHPELRERFRR